MNEQERSELEMLKRRHERLGEEFGLLSKQLEALEKRLRSAEPQPGQTPQKTPQIEAKPPQPNFKLKLPDPSPASRPATPQPEKPSAPAPVVPKPTPTP